MGSNRVLHVVVGAGNVNYFSNAIRSIKSHDAGDVFAVYNFIDSEDLAAISRAQQALQGLGVTLHIQENIASGRTGSLYSANNIGLDFARRAYDFVSFLQADMQLMWWDQKIVSSARRILETLPKEGRNLVSFYTQLPVAGKRKHVYEGWAWDTTSGAHHTTGHADVCLIPIFDDYNSEFEFCGDEASMIAKQSSREALMIFHPFPFAAPIPFPVTTRDRSKRENDAVSISADMVLKKNPNFLPDFSRATFHPFSMEESVVPNGWSCLTPYWPSDTRDLRWIRTRYLYYKNDLWAFFSVRREDGKDIKFPVSAFRPGLRNLVISLCLLAVKEVGAGRKKK